MKTSIKVLKVQKNICRFTVFLEQCSDIYNQEANSLDLPAVINISAAPVYAKVCSHVGVGAHILGYVK